MIAEMRPLFLTLILVAGIRAELLDLAPFARPCCSAGRHLAQTTFDYSHVPGVVKAEDGRWIYGLQWAEERDIAQIRVRFRGEYDARALSVEYWFRNWPYSPPRMPAIEDPVDDPWQGRWITAKTAVGCDGPLCTWTFQPLTGEENSRAGNLPAVRYRRAIKVRLVFPAGVQPALEGVEVFSETTLEQVELRVHFNGAAKARYFAYNGHVRGVKAFQDAVLLQIDSADPKPAGSNDVTVVQVQNGDRSFAFTPADAARRPMYLPDFGAYIALASDRTPLTPALARAGLKIRERLRKEPEQTYERASREIPALDPVERQEGSERLYLPLAADASWQKFALEWGGNVHISKRGTKAKGRELDRLIWTGDRITWRIGTGATPGYRPRSADSTLSLLEDSLPIVTARWTSDSIDYEQESFATLLSGPLSPEDPGRGEQTPAVLLMRIRARNASRIVRASHLWLGTEPAEPLAFSHGLLTADDGRSVRMSVVLAPGAEAALAPGLGLHVIAQIEPGRDSVTYLALPFIPGLDDAQQAALKRIDFGSERARVLDYWRGAVAKGMPFHVPEQRFNTFARGLLARIRVSATKDPPTGVYMVPAAGYNYAVYANEAVFQCQLLDIAGYHDLAARYLQAQIDMQGSKPFAGMFTGDQKAVYHGARVNQEYDYTASNYNLDHGAVLWSLAEHYFLTRDKAWLARVAPSMKRAADWIIEQRKLTQVMDGAERCPEYGLLPAGNLEDNDDWGHWFAVNAYASLGLSELAAALEDTGDAAAARYTREAETYRADLRSAVMRAVASSPVVRLRDHTWVPYVPTRVHQRIRLFGPLRTGYYSRYPQKVLPTYRLSATRELLYGPLILLDAGIFDAHEPLASWVLDDWEDNSTMSEPLGLHVHGWVDEAYWFSRGGMVFQANLQNPIRSYIRRGESRAAVRDLYNDFVSCYYPGVNIFTEEYRQWRSASGPFYKVPDEAKFVHRLRDLLVTEYQGDLLLAPGAPSRWLGEGFSVTDAPTRYGPLTYSIRSRGGEVRALVMLPERNPFRNAWLHLPEGTDIGSVRIDGKPWIDFDRERRRIRLPKPGRRLEVVVLPATPKE